MSRRSCAACAAAVLAGSLLIGAAPVTAQSGGGGTTTACAAPSPSSGAGFGGFLTTGTNGVAVLLLSSTDIPADMCGSLVVAFHGDPSTGCARLDLCGVSGQAIWTPAGPAEITLLTYRTRGRTLTQGSLATFGPFVSSAGVTTEVTRIAPDGTAHECLDDSANAPELGISSLPGRRLRIGGPGGLASAELTGSRCAGPLAADIASALPSATLPAGALQRAGTVVDLSGVRTFDGPGLSGTVSSTLTVVTGRAATQRAPSTATGAAPQRNQPAYAEAKLAIEQVSGAVTAHNVGPASSAACAVLDACGLTETLSVAPRGTGVMELLVRLPAGTGSPLARLLRAAAGAGAAIGYGQISGRGLVQATAMRSDGSPTCTDTVPISGSLVFIAVSHGRAELSSDASDESDPFRTRCPGPALSDFVASPFGGLATTSVRLSSLLARATTLVLGHAISGVSADGYRLRTSSRLRMRLRLRGVTVVKDPALTAALT